MKFCGGCKEHKPIRDFHKFKHAKDGLCSQCKNCANARTRNWNLRNSNRTPVPTVTQKTCTNCKILKPAVEFYSEPFRKDGLRPICCVCHNQQVGERTRQNPEVVRVRWQRWQANNRDHLRNYNRRWSNENRLNVRANSANTRARKSGSEEILTAKDLVGVFHRFNGLCLSCGSSDKIEFDHVIPLSKGGSNTEDNLQLLCHSCNSGKKDQTTDYRGAQFE